MFTPKQTALARDTIALTSGAMPMRRLASRGSAPVRLRAPSTLSSKHVIVAPQREVLSKLGRLHRDLHQKQKRRPKAPPSA